MPPQPLVAFAITWMAERLNGHRTFFAGFDLKLSDRGLKLALQGKTCYKIKMPGSKHASNRHHAYFALGNT